MYCYPLYKATIEKRGGTSGPKSYVLKKTFKTVIEGRTSFSSVTATATATDNNVMQTLQDGCTCSAEFDVSRLNILIKLIRIAIEECTGIDVAIGIPVSIYLQRKLILKCLVPSIHEHCKAFHHFIMVSAGCGQTYNEGPGGEGGGGGGGSVADNSIKELNVERLVATIRSLRDGVRVFVESLEEEEEEELQELQELQELHEPRHEGKQEKLNENGNAINLGIALRLVFVYLCETCTWLCSLLLQKISIMVKKIKNKTTLTINKHALLKRINQYIVHDVVVELASARKENKALTTATITATFDQLQHKLQQCVQVLEPPRVNSTIKVLDLVGNDEGQGEQGEQGEQGGGGEKNREEADEHSGLSDSGEWL